MSDLGSRWCNANDIPIMVISMSDARAGNGRWTGARRECLNEEIRVRLWTQRSLSQSETGSLEGAVHVQTDKGKQQECTQLTHRRKLHAGHRTRGERTHPVPHPAPLSDRGWIMIHLWLCLLELILFSFSMSVRRSCRRVGRIGAVGEKRKQISMWFFELSH